MKQNINTDMTKNIPNFHNLVAPVVGYTQAYLDFCLGINSLYQGIRIH